MMNLLFKKQIRIFGSGLAIALLILLGKNVEAAESRTICGETVSSNTYTGAIPSWLDGNAVIYDSSLTVPLGVVSSNAFATNSILNSFGTYGSSFSTSSIFNSFGTYGNSFSSYSVCNTFASGSNVPQIWRNGVLIGYLTKNQYLSGAIDPTVLVAALLKQGFGGVAMTDLSAPSVPTGFSGVAVSPTQINFVWNASTDNVGVVAYVLYSGNTVTNILASSPTGLALSGLSPATSYTFSLAACDAANNCSNRSNAITVTTPGATTTTTTTTTTAAPSTTTTVASTTSTTQVPQPVNIYLSPGQNYDLSSSNVNIYGNTQNEIVNLSSGVRSVVVDVNVESVTLPGALADYGLKSDGLNIFIYKNADLIVTVPVQRDSDGTQLTFFNGGQGTFTNGSYNGSGTYNATVNSGVISVGGVPLSTTSPTMLGSNAVNNSTSATTSTTTTSAVTTTTTTAIPTTTATPNTTLANNVNLLSGWNLIGNGYSRTLDVGSVFGDKSLVVSVWKWLADKAMWAFYAPSMSSVQLQAYVQAKNYEVLSTIEAGEGFWVNAVTAWTLTTDITGKTAIGSNDFSANGDKALPPGWSLIATGDGPTPSIFNSKLSTAPPSAGVIPTNFISLWAWDASVPAWQFYAPSLQANGTLDNYIQTKQYQSFGNKTLTPGTGFWVNKP